MLNSDIISKLETIIIILIDKNLNIKDANKGAELFYDFTIEELKKKSLKDITEESYHKSLTFKKKTDINQQRFNSTHITKDGKFKYTEIKYSFTDNNLILITVIDIDKEIKIRNSLKESEEKYKAAFYTSPDSVNINRMDGLYVDINLGFTNLTGFTREDVIGKTSSEINIWAIPEDREKLIAGLKENGYVENLQSKFRCKDGSFKIALMSARVININSEPHILSVTRNITDILKIHEEILTERERLSVTLRSIGDAVITTDINGNITMLNKVAEKITGWSNIEAHGKYITEVFKIVNEDAKDKIIDPVKKVIETSEITELKNNTILITKSKNEISIADSGAPIRNKYSETIGVVLVFRDVTEKRMLDEVMQKSQKLEALDVLAGGIAHDFNNLLTGILGFIDLAKSENKNKSIDSYLSSSISAMEKATSLTTQLLTYSKCSMPLKDQNDIKKIIKDSLSFIFTGSNIVYKVNVDEENYTSFFDKNQIAQVIDNLLINAKQAMPDGGEVNISIQNIILSDKNIYSLKSGNYISIKISDTGKGIPGNIIKNIFDPFFTTKEKGSGLGLATCYSIVSKHNGIITAESDHGKGSTFTVILPKIESKGTKLVHTKNEVFKSHGKIIILDDEEMIRNFLSIKLKSFGYSVISFSKGEDVLEIIKDNNSLSDYSAMIFDLTIRGGIGGKKLIEIIREYSNNIPVFVTSGYSSDPIISNPTKYGFTDSISKPIESKRLIYLLKKYLISD